ncbi:MAG TPA: 4-hydroxy-3-methylbut-2-enyl diphosphate reductase [Phycisphaerae bacterium]|nr:4-hydroxy-3-methylbut-2-enyl diphosphate reductase [Phycisphaerae bacterium]
MPMKILLANPRGFCAGVNMAIDCVDRVLKLKGPPIYVYHEIVHNKHVVDRFIKQGVVFVNSIDEVPNGGTVVYSAHGVSPEIRHKSENRDLVQVDATCPLVTKVHSEAIRFAKKKYTIVLIGHEDHDEVIGTLGEAPDCIRIVESPEDVAKLDIPMDHKIAYLTQTTLSIDDANVIINALKQKFPHIHSPKKEDICYATTNRQQAVMELAPRSDLVLVVGSKNSSNSLRLVEIAENRGIKGYLVDDVSEINHDWLKGVNTLLLTAGASAPEDLVQAIIKVLQEKYHATVEDAHVTEEDMHFELPYSLRKLEEEHAVQLTVSGR